VVEEAIGQRGQPLPTALALGYRTAASVRDDAPQRASSEFPATHPQRCPSKPERLQLGRLRAVTHADQPNTCGVVGMQVA